MNYQIFTHTHSEKLVRRFFVSKTERNLYRIVEKEINSIMSGKIADGTFKYLTLRSLYEYVENRWYTFDREKWKDFVYYYRFMNHMKDYCDVVYGRRFGKLYRYPYRMSKMSEPLAINKEKLL